jgi:hypothetical protein
VLANPGLGVLLPERTAEAAARGVIEALSTDWDRDAIRRFAEQQSWQATAERVNEVFESVLSKRCQP